MNYHSEWRSQAKQCSKMLKQWLQRFFDRIPWGNGTPSAPRPFQFNGTSKWSGRAIPSQFQPWQTELRAVTLIEPDSWVSWVWIVWIFHLSSHLWIPLTCVRSRFWALLHLMPHTCERWFWASRGLWIIAPYFESAAGCSKKLIIQ